MGKLGDFGPVALGSIEQESGWLVRVQFPEKERGEDGKFHHVEDVVHFPRIAEKFNDGWPLWTTRSFGQMVSEGFSRFVPKMEPVYDKASPDRAWKTGRAVEKIRDDPTNDPPMIMNGTYERTPQGADKKEYEDALGKLKAQGDVAKEMLKIAKADGNKKGVQICKDKLEKIAEERKKVVFKFRGEKSPLRKAYPLMYVRVKEGWAPQIVMNDLWNRDKAAKEAEREELITKAKKEFAKRDKAFHKMFKAAKTYCQKLEALINHTVTFPKLTRKEKRVGLEQKKSCRVVENPVATRASIMSYSGMPKGDRNPYNRTGTFHRSIKSMVNKAFKKDELEDWQIQVAKNKGLLEA